MWGEILTAAEVEYCSKVRDELRGVSWVAPLISQLDAGRWSYETKPLLFELRVATEIHRAGIAARYEYPTGVGTTSVDFQFELEGREWFVELVSILVSQAIKSATWEAGPIFGTTLSSDGGTQSTGGELILAQQKIGEKVWDGDAYVKFPEPMPGRFHVILADMRGMAITGGDHADYVQLAYGDRPFGGEDHPLVDRFKGKVVRGLFEPMNDRPRSAPRVRARVHFLGFCSDESYGLGTLQRGSIYLHNPKLVADQGCADILARFPLCAPKRA